MSDDFKKYVVNEQEDQYPKVAVMGFVEKQLKDDVVAKKKKDKLTWDQIIEGCFRFYVGKKKK